MRVALLIGGVVLGLVGCQSDDAGGDGGAEVCMAEPPTECPSDMPTFDDVQPIFQERCVVCHQGQGESEMCPTCWALVDYQHIADWADTIRSEMIECSMPPPSSGVTMTNAERLKILEWIRCGAPE